VQARKNRRHYPEHALSTFVHAKGMVVDSCFVRYQPEEGLILVPFAAKVGQESTMDITRRLIGTSGILKESQPDIVGVDLDSIIRRLIMFDTYILKTIKLQEFPFLVAELGFSGTMQLLESPAFQIEGECTTRRPGELWETLPGSGD
jgi:hypothetical protein